MQTTFIVFVFVNINHNACICLHLQCDIPVSVFVFNHNTCFCLCVQSQCRYLSLSSITIPVFVFVSVSVYNQAACLCLCEQWSCHYCCVSCSRCFPQISPSPLWKMRNWQTISERKHWTMSIRYDRTNHHQLVKKSLPWIFGVHWMRVVAQDKAGGYPSLNNILPTKILKWQNIHFHRPNFGCDKIFSSYSYLNAHIRTTHEKVKDKQCPHCDETFHEMNSAFKAHVNRHTDNRQFSCETCGKSFLVEPHLKEHAKRHTRPYFCDQCDHQTGSNTSLKRHKRIVHEQQQIECRHGCGWKGWETISRGRHEKPCKLNPLPNAPFTVSAGIASSFTLQVKILDSWEIFASFNNLEKCVFNRAVATPVPTSQSHPIPIQMFERVSG